MLQSPDNCDSEQRGAGSANHSPMPRVNSSLTKATCLGCMYAQVDFSGGSLLLITNTTTKTRKQDVLQ